MYISVGESSASNTGGAGFQSLYTYYLEGMWITNPSLMCSVSGLAWWPTKDCWICSSLSLCSFIHMMPERKQVWMPHVMLVIFKSQGFRAKLNVLLCVQYTPTTFLKSNPLPSSKVSSVMLCTSFSLWTQGLVLARQALSWNLSHSTCWLRTKILLISASWVARIMGVSHGHPAPLCSFSCCVGWN
jgi:hypothetical protein